MNAADNWNIIEEKLKGLWPTTFSKHMTPDAKALWIKMLGQRPLDAVVCAIEILAGSTGFFPRPYELIKVLDKNKTQRSVHQEKVAGPDEMAAHRQRIEAEIRFINSVPKAKIKEAQARILMANPKMAIALSKIKETHPGWRAMIVRLLRDGIVDEEEEVIF